MTMRLWLYMAGLLSCGRLWAGDAGWSTYADTNRHFHFEYPGTWKINPETFPVMHYRLVFVTLHNVGKETFALKEQETATNTWTYGGSTIIAQLPPGGVAMDIGWWEGPWPRFGPGIAEMEAADLSAVLKVAKEETTGDGRLITRTLDFRKWGRHWSITVYLRTPVATESHRDMERVLTSFRFDGVPAGDEIWAIGESRKKLPPDADPDKFEREGGSPVYHVNTAKSDNDVIVTFIKRPKGSPGRTWCFRVTAEGKVLLLREPAKDH